MRLVSPTFAGRADEIRIAATRFGLPPGSRVSRSRGGAFAWVLLRDGTLHALVAGGEVVTIPTPLADLVRATHFAKPLAGVNKIPT